MWPVVGIVGENGAFAFSYDHENQKITRLYWKTEAERQQDRIRLEAVKRDVLERVPGSRVSADQNYREADLAIDFCMDIEALTGSEIQTIVECFTRAGAQAKISSIHVNGWFGEYDKLSMARYFFAKILGQNLDMLRDQSCLAGSQNCGAIFQHLKLDMTLISPGQGLQYIENIFFVYLNAFLIAEKAASKRGKQECNL